MAETDAELAAMRTVVEALKALDEDARSRVLDWAASRFGIKATKRSPEAPARTESPGDDVNFELFADLLDATGAHTDDDRVLAAGYWHQVIEGNGTFTGKQANDVLKDTGYGIDNITHPLDRLKARKPAAVRQVSKTAQTKQGRKTYKLTNEGARTVERMIRGQESDEE